MLAVIVKDWMLYFCGTSTRWVLQKWECQAEFLVSMDSVKVNRVQYTTVHAGRLKGGVCWWIYGMPIVQCWLPMKKISLNLYAVLYYGVVFIALFVYMFYLRERIGWMYFGVVYFGVKILFYLISYLEVFKGFRRYIKWDLPVTVIYLAILIYSVKNELIWWCLWRHHWSRSLHCLEL